VNEIRLYHAHRVCIGTADKTIATGVLSGEGSGLNNCRTLKSERKALDKKSGGTIKPLILSAARPLTAEIANFPRQTDLLLARKALFGR
jgi:hypothetical protein